MNFILFIDAIIQGDIEEYKVEMGAMRAKVEFLKLLKLGWINYIFAL